MAMQLPEDDAPVTPPAVPSRDILELPPPPADERLAYGTDPLHFGDLRLPAGPGPHPLVIFVHGGFWRAEYALDYFGHACANLAADGIATWNIEYRRIGNHGGAWPGTFLDVAAAADHVRALALDYPIDTDRVIAVGHSAGGHLALWLAGPNRIEGDAPHLQPAPPARRDLARRRRRFAPRLELGLGEGVVRELLGGTPEECSPLRRHFARRSPPARRPPDLIHGELDIRSPTPPARTPRVPPPAATASPSSASRTPATSRSSIRAPRSAQRVRDAINAALGIATLDISSLFDEA
ncbi:MAG: alpha/beta hydrolase [Chloroflexia bacterium]